MWELDQVILEVLCISWFSVSLRLCMKSLIIAQWSMFWEAQPSPFSPFSSWLPAQTFCMKLVMWLSRIFFFKKKNHVMFDIHRRYIRNIKWWDGVIFKKYICELITQPKNYKNEYIGRCIFMLPLTFDERLKCSLQCSSLLLLITTPWDKD